MEGIVSRMRLLALAATPLLPEFSKEMGPGHRLVAIVILQMTPSLDYLDWLVERMRMEQPSVFFQACVALLAMVRSFGRSARDQLLTAVENCRETLSSFKGGKPDQGALDVLDRARTELR